MIANREKTGERGETGERQGQERQERQERQRGQQVGFRVTLNMKQHMHSTLNIESCCRPNSNFKHEP